MKILVTYFSATATTKEIARMISKELNADLFEIEPVEKYTSADLNWMDQNSRSSKENADRKTRPAIKEYPKNLDEYDAILLGFPIWWYREPRIIDTFLENAKLENKTIVYKVQYSDGTEINIYPIEEKLYDSVNRLIDRSDPDSIMTMNMLLNVQERMQKLLIESNKILSPFLDMTQYIESIDSSVIDEDPERVVKLDATKRENLRNAANKVLLELNAV